jgi:hypothetical protein
VRVVSDGGVGKRRRSPCDLLDIPQLNVNKDVAAGAAVLELEQENQQRDDNDNNVPFLAQLSRRCFVDRVIYAHAILREQQPRTLFGFS